MILMIPVDKDSFEDAKIVPLEKREVWAVVDMNQGFIQKLKFVDSRRDVDELVDYLIIKSANEDVEEFLDDGIEVLVAPLQSYMEDVIEAYKFRELHEL